MKIKKYIKSLSNQNHTLITKTILFQIKSDYRFLTILLLFNLFFHIILWIGWPLHNGGDGITYIYYYIDSFNSQPVYHNLMCFRLPIAPFFFGSLLSIGGSTLTSVVLELLALSAVLMIYLTVRQFGKWPARIITILFTFMIPYQIQFHQVTSDGIFAWFIILFFFILQRLLYNNTINRLWLFLGITIALATLTRPNGLALILVVLVIPFLKLGWKKMLSITLVLLVGFSFIIGGYITYKNIRYKDISITRGFNGHIFYRVFRLQDSAIKLENGPYTRKFINLIEKYILTSELYKNYDISLKEFLTYKPNSRLWGDSLVIVDQKEDWNSNYKLLANVSIEAIKAEPNKFFIQYIKDIIKLLSLKPQLPSIPLETNNSNSDVIILNEKGLPIPTEGEIIPESTHWWLSTRPDGTFPSDSEIKELQKETKLITNKYINLKGNKKIKRIINIFWDLFYIPITYLYIFGIVGIFYARGRERIFLLTIIFIYIIIVIGTMLGTSPWIRYRLPLDSIILLSGGIGLSLFIKRLLLSISSKIKCE